MKAAYIQKSYSQCSRNRFICSAERGLHLNEALPVVTSVVAEQ